MKSGHFQILTFNHLSLNNCHVGLAWALLREMCRQQRAAIGQNRHFYHSFPAFEELPSRPAARPPPSSSFWLAAFRGISKAAADVDATLSDWFGPLTPLSVRPSVVRLLPQSRGSLSSLRILHSIILGVRQRPPSRYSLPCHGMSFYFASIPEQQCWLQTGPFVVRALFLPSNDRTRVNARRQRLLLFAA